MWRPDNVIPEHKGRARIIWGALLCSMLTYVTWQIVSLAEKRANPNTSITVSNDMYNFPVVLVCMWHGIGCAYSNVSVCSSSAIGKWSKVMYGHQRVNATLSKHHDNCVEFDLTTIDVGDGTETDVPTRAIMRMIWSETGKGDELATYDESIGVALVTEEGDLDESDMVYIPYARERYLSPELTFIMTYLTFGKTIRTFLGEESITTFPTLTVSSTEYVTALNTSDWNAELGKNVSFGENAMLGGFDMLLTQGRYSLSIIEDIDPVDFGTFLGNLGGFWELLIIAWGVCFISALRDSTPTLRARSFSKHFEKGKTAITTRLSINSSQTYGPDPDESHDRFQWRTAHRYTASSSGREDFGGRPQNAAFQADRRTNTGSRRPVALGVPRRMDIRGSSIGGPQNSTRVEETNDAMPTQNPP